MFFIIFEKYLTAVFSYNSVCYFYLKKPNNKMILKYKNYEIELFEEQNYTLNSADNLRFYNKIYFEGKHQEDRFYPNNKLAIIVKEFEIEISSALICEIGGQNSVFKNSFIIEDDKIWIRVCNKIYCLEIPNLEIQWNREFDFATVFSFVKIENDFITHGELEIKRITRNGEIVWSFAGRDIWVNIEGKAELKIENDTIILFDFESNKYVLNFVGQLIEDYPNIFSNNNEICVINLYKKIYINHINSIFKKIKNTLNYRNLIVFVWICTNSFSNS
ncbi:Urease accessory protein UreD [Flavobacterium branchiophilum]